MVRQDPGPPRFEYASDFLNGVWEVETPDLEKAYLKGFVDRIYRDYDALLAVLVNEKKPVKIQALPKILEKKHKLKITKGQVQFLHSMLLKHDPEISKKVDTFEKRVQKFNLL